MVIGVRGEFMAFGRARLPPGRPVVAQAAVAGLGALVGSEKADLDVLALEHVGNQRRRAHVAGVKCQIQRVFAVFERKRVCSPRQTYVYSYKFNSIHGVRRRVMPRL